MCTQSPPYPSIDLCLTFDGCQTQNNNTPTPWHTVGDLARLLWCPFHQRSFLYSRQCLLVWETSHLSLCSGEQKVTLQMNFNNLWLCLSVCLNRFCCDIHVAKLMREHSLGNSVFMLYHKLCDQHSEDWMERSLQYLTVCDRFQGIKHKVAPLYPHRGCLVSACWAQSQGHLCLWVHLEDGLHKNVTYKSHYFIYNCTCTFDPL